MPAIKKKKNNYNIYFLFFKQIRDILMDLYLELYQYLCRISLYVEVVIWYPS